MDIILYYFDVYFYYEVTVSPYLMIPIDTILPTAIDIIL